MAFTLPERRYMNISFHYFTVKTLCYFANLPEGRAQNIAFYSQLVDDFNLSNLMPGDPIYVAAKPPQFFLDHNLAAPMKEKNRWVFYPATTGINTMQTVRTLMNQLHQKYTIIPFHFIPQAPFTRIKGEDIDIRCAQTEPGTPCLMNTLLDEFFDAGETNDIKLGLMLHVYADTYAHQKFSGRWGNENYSKIISAIDTSKTPNKEVGQEVKKYYILPAVGHAELGHVPDAFALKFTANFTAKKEKYDRDNMPTFLLCAKRIWSMLRQYNHQAPMDEKYFDQEIAPRIREAGNACIDGASEVMDAGRLAKIWAGKFPECKYQYAYNEKWGLPKTVMTEEETALKIDIYKPVPEFYAYNQCAYEHLYRVCHTYRVEENL